MADIDWAVPDPRRAANAAEFVAEMRRLRAWSGLTFRQLERNAASAGDVLPHSTLVAALRRDRLPREDLLRAFTRACGCDPAEVAEWMEVRRRLAAALAEPPPTPETPSSALATAAEEHTGGGGHRAGAGSKRARRIRGWPSVPVMLAVLGSLAAVLVMPGSAVRVPSGPAARQEATYGGCRLPLMMGAYGPCVVRLQERLRLRGLDLPVDAWYGPYTKMRVAAFQTLAGLPNTGMVDHETWRALEPDGRIVVARMPAAKVRQRIEEVFGDAAAEAIELAECLSTADPLWIFSTEPGVRRWGLFQFTDLELHRAGATQAMALDPEWNIQAAHAVWKRTGDFRHWKCDPTAVPEAASGIR
ncbi:peptidoglycan-binding protein [Thermostaphylospora chromogena]|uniref:Putative peptidoglycan binding domain-containing protein n=1 Tax=Thermostaphylospora chromogena TaxID=35622 RepID=A0A1H1C6G5_9ACTN|nr:peptidoglycan-binding protein [Thermostaphylospora chromogena]SDQ59793.1 Putative peptidoglycan binding domain-containing protein [Thermostaphylospora chromogena]